MVQVRGSAHAAATAQVPSHVKEVSHRHARAYRCDTPWTCLLKYILRVYVLPLNITEAAAVLHSRFAEPL